MQKKSVLLFCLSFFHYEEKLRQGLEALGYNVDHYDERPGNSLPVKAMLRLRLPGHRLLAGRHCRRVIAENRDKDYDYVLVVKSEVLGREEIALLREAYPRAQFILYLWDGLENVPGGTEKLGLYDRVYTFDPEDAAKYGLHFRPLFYTGDYSRAQAPDRYDYDVAFIGTAHAIRPRVVRQVEAQCRESGLRFYHYLYLPHPLLFWYHKLTNRSYRGVKKSDIHYTPLPAQAIRDIYTRSRAILDVEHTRQRGLTMRTIEMLGMEKKLITTNPMVKRHDFYDEGNILVIDRDDPRIDPGFLSGEFHPLSPAIREKYSLPGFLRELLKNGES